MTDSLGADFARAVAAKDMPTISALLHREVDFRGMTPGRVWDADGLDGRIGWLRIMCAGYRPVTEGLVPDPHRIVLARVPRPAPAQP